MPSPAAAPRVSSRVNATAERRRQAASVSASPTTALKTAAKTSAKTKTTPKKDNAATKSGRTPNGSADRHASSSSDVRSGGDTDARGGANGCSGGDVDRRIGAIGDKPLNNGQTSSGSGGADGGGSGANDGGGSANGGGSGANDGGGSASGGGSGTNGDSGAISGGNGANGGGIATTRDSGCSSSGSSDANGSGGGAGSGSRGNCCCSNSDVLARLTAMEEKLGKVEEEGKLMRGEIWELRDRLEEEEDSKRRLERKTESLEEETVLLKEEVAKEKEATSKRVKELAEKNNREERVIGDNRQAVEVNRRRCVVLTDSNGKGATSDSIRNHLPRNEKDSLQIEVVVAYTTTAAIDKVDRNSIDVSGATVVIDNLTNDARGTQGRPAMTPRELVNSVAKLRQKLTAAGASSVVVCQLKPMQVTDVTPYNTMISDYLRPLRGGYGCRTQIKLHYLKSDGFHIQPMYDSIIDRTYACAIQGVPVPCPTPLDQFIPDRMRRRWESDWPRIGKGAGLNMNHGWKW